MARTLIIGNEGRPLRDMGIKVLDNQVGQGPCLEGLHATHSISDLAPDLRRQVAIDAVTLRRRLAKQQGVPGKDVVSAHPFSLVMHWPTLNFTCL